MRNLTYIFLLSVAIFTSGYRFRCVLFCSEQTGVQNDYTENRDDCRSDAQNKLDDAMAETSNPDNEKFREAKLISLFSKCMATKGWSVPSGEKQKADKASDVPIYASSVSSVAAPATVAVAATTASIADQNAVPATATTTATIADEATKLQNQNLPNQNNEIIKQPIPIKKSQIQDRPQVSPVARQAVDSQSIAPQITPQLPPVVTPQLPMSNTVNQNSIPTKTLRKTSAENNRLSDIVSSDKTAEKPAIQTSPPAVTQLDNEISKQQPTIKKAFSEQPNIDNNPLNAQPQVTQPPIQQPIQQPPPNKLQNQLPSKTASKRANECAYARYASSVSSAAARLAAICDKECAVAIQAAPDGQIPVSCPRK